MRYAIMSDGKETRQNNYMDTTKQTISINEENLLQRTIRLLHENEIYDILILSHDRRHWINGIKHVESNINEENCNIYHLFADDKSRFVYVESEFYNINTPNDYHILLKKIKKETDNGKNNCKF